MGWRPSKNVGKPDHLWRVGEDSLLTCQGRLRSFSLYPTERTPVNGAQSGSHENLLKPGGCLWLSTRSHSGAKSDYRNCGIEYSAMWHTASYRNPRLHPIEADSLQQLASGVSMRYASGYHCSIIRSIFRKVPRLFTSLRMAEVSSQTTFRRSAGR
jgi:hypothetical protein